MFRVPLVLNQEWGRLARELALLVGGMGRPTSCAFAAVDDRSMCKKRLAHLVVSTFAKVVDYRIFYTVVLRGVAQRCACFVGCHAVWGFVYLYWYLIRSVWAILLFFQDTCVDVC